MILRYERKYFLSEYMTEIIKRRASALMRPDSHSNGVYRVCNIYFDDVYNSFYHDKHRGAYTRSKWRLRWYNDDISFMRLERKLKEGHLVSKESVLVNEDNYNILRAGRIEEIFETDGIWNEFALIHRLRPLRPAVMFTYHREAYVLDTADTRLTFDTDIASPARIPDIMELKYTHFLPDHVREIFSGLPMVQTEMSKYCEAVDFKNVNTRATY